VAAQMIGRLHRHADVYRPPRGFACRRLDGDWLFGARYFVRAAGSRKMLDRSQRTIATNAERLVRDAMARLGQSKGRFGVIHADLNLANIVFDRGRASPIDFDEFGKCWYVFDLAELIRTSIRPDNWAQRKQLAIDAYMRERKLDDVELEAFDAFIVATFVQYLNWAFIHARSRHDLRWVGFCVDVMRGIMRGSAS
jgi:Ser/Thr protein kinase RdoA (MazF antagonist)